jgi:uncharacterized iron-regulated membrane protein
MKLWLLKFHRWLALLFALPLVLVLGTGLVLSLEPWLVVRSIEPGYLTPARIHALLGQHDPDGRARSLAYRSYDKSLSIGAGRGAGTVVDTATGQVLSEPSALARLLVTTRRMHETLLIDARWLVIGSTVAMLVLAFLGVLMGLPRIRNTVSGWHKGMAWGLLPLIVLSPLTGLFLAWGITFASSAPSTGSAQGAPMSLSEAVRIVGERHDLSRLVWLRPQGGRLLARFVERGEYRVYAVTREGTEAVPRNWPRLWHEGNFAGSWSASMNVVVSLAMIGLLVTGPWIWLRRRLRRRAHRLQADVRYWEAGRAR